MIVMSRRPDASPQFQKSQSWCRSARPASNRGTDDRVRPRRAAWPRISSSATAACPRATCCWARARLQSAGPSRTGRIHHCTRSIGSAEGARPDNQRGATRTAFGGLIQLGRASSWCRRAHRDQAMTDGAEGHKRWTCWATARPACSQHGQNDGAGEGLPDHRPGDADRRHRRIAVVASVGGNTSTSVTCASPTARTRSITWWSGGRRSAATDRLDYFRLSSSVATWAHSSCREQVATGRAAWRYQ